jgi:cytochrome c-type biogenesis protein CcmH/NrfF
MTKKHTRRGRNRPQRSRSGETIYWKAAAILAVLFCIALIVRIEMAPTPPQRTQTTAEAPVSPYGDLAQTKAQLVASEFECACGQCENTALTNCSCDFPHGALEEKDFIRRELKKGRSVEDVIQLIDRKYGHRIG